MDVKGKERGILKLDSRPRVLVEQTGSRAELTPQGSCDHPPCSPQPSVDRLSVTWADPGSMSSSGVNLFHLPSETPINNEVKFSTATGDGSEDEDYSASLSAVLRQRRASVRRSRKGRQRRPSSPFLGEENGPRRRSSVFTTSSGDTAISMEDGPSAVVTQEQIFENIHLHKEVLGSVKQQPLGMRRKLKIVYQAKTYIKRHEGQLQERLAQSKSTRDIYARFNILMATKWQQLKREAANMSNLLIPWELRIKEIESHFGSVVASYFTFLRWLFWVNLVIGFILLVFVIIPEYLTANPNQDGERKNIMPDEETNATNLLTLWEFEGRLKYSAIFYGFYSNIERVQYRMPLAYFLTGLAVYIYSFVAILRKMAENSRMSKLSEKEDECIFSWKLFTGWDFMIGNAETAHNRIASVILGFKEALLEEAEKKKDLRNWRVISLRAVVNICVVILLAVSAYAVVTVVYRSDDDTKVKGWWRENETTVVVTGISITFPVFFELLGFLEHYHPRKQLRLQLARIMLLNLLNLYSLIFALFSKIDGMSIALDELKPKLTYATSNNTLNISTPIPVEKPNSCIEKIITCGKITVLTSLMMQDHAVTESVTFSSYILNNSPFTVSFQEDTKRVKRERDDDNIFGNTMTTKDAGILELERLKNIYKPKEDLIADDIDDNYSYTYDSYNDTTSSTTMNTENTSENDIENDTRKADLITSTHDLTSDLTTNKLWYSEITESTYKELYTSTPITNNNIDYYTYSPIITYLNDTNITTEQNEMSSNMSDINVSSSTDSIYVATDKTEISSLYIITDSRDYDTDINTVTEPTSIESISAEISLAEHALTEPASTDPILIENTIIESISTESISSTTETLDLTSQTSKTMPIVNETSVTTMGSSKTCPISRPVSFNCTIERGNQNITQVFYLSNCNVVNVICYMTSCEKDVDNTGKSNATDQAIDTVYLDSDNRIMYNLTITTRKKLLKLCWETMFGQELVKLTMMDLVFVLLGTLFMDFYRALFVRYMNRCWCWDLEKNFPEYGDFKIAENILHLINNQGMVWMGMFFSPGLVVINVFKLMIMMYLRSWAVMTCNVPHEVVFRVSKSNNFYLALLLTMLFLCVLPVGYTIVWVKPSWHCGPFSEYDKIYYILTNNIYKVLPKTLSFSLEYIASPAIVIPLLVLLILIIYYLTSLTNSLREANNDLKIQLRRERTEERRKMFQLADTRRRAGSSAMDNTPFARWKRALPSLPMSKSIDSDDRKTSHGDETNEPQKISRKKGGIFAKIVGLALDKKSDIEAVSETVIATPSPNNQDDETDTDFHETLPKEVLKIKDITIEKPEPKKRNSVEFKTEEDRKYKTNNKNFKLKHAKVDNFNEKDIVKEKLSREINERTKEIARENKMIREKQISQSSTQSKQSFSDSIGSVIPVITISTTESDEDILSKKSTKDKGKDKTESKMKKSPDLKSLRRQSSVESINEQKPPKEKKQDDGHKYQYSL